MSLGWLFGKESEQALFARTSVVAERAKSLSCIELSTSFFLIPSVKKHTSYTTIILEKKNTNPLQIPVLSTSIILKKRTVLLRATPPGSVGAFRGPLLPLYGGPSVREA